MREHVSTVPALSQHQVTAGKDSCKGDTRYARVIWTHMQMYSDNSSLAQEISRTNARDYIVWLLLGGTRLIMYFWRKVTGGQPQGPT